VLKPLHVFQRDKDGDFLLNRNGDRIPLAEPVPKQLEEFTPDEQASWARELAEDNEWRTRADRRRLQDDIIATAARLIAAEAGR
jgi:hypothetical protein